MSEGAAAQIKKVGLRTPVASMTGIGPKRAEALEAKGIRIVEDLFYAADIAGRAFCRMRTASDATSIDCSFKPAWRNSAES